MNRTPPKPSRLLAICVALVATLLAPSCHERGVDRIVPEATASSVGDLLPRGQPPFTFVVTGHAYGRPGLFQPRPARTLVAGAGLMWQDAPDFTVLLGDTLFDWRSNEMDVTLPFLHTDLPSPVINVVGNHEQADLKLHVAHFGAPFHTFEHAGCRMIVLDSESDPWRISGHQLRFLLDELRQLLNRDDPPRMCCLFSHKPVWAMTRHTVLTALLGNAAADLEPLVESHLGPESFAHVVLPLLRELAQTVPVACFAGDFGAFPPVGMHLFAQQDPIERSLNYYGVGIGDHYRDAFMTVTVPAVGLPRVRAHQLVTGAELPLSEYDHQDWLQEWFPHGLPGSILALLDS